MRAGPPIEPAPTARGCRGSSFIEVLVASLLVAMTLLGMCGMFVLGYSHVNTAGKTTMGVSATRQLLEDVKLVPFDQLVNLDNFDTDNPSSLPAGGLEREVARRWRYALAGDGVGWSFTSAETTRWTDLSVQGKPLGARGQIDVVQQSKDLNQIVVRVSVPGRWRAIEISTLIARL